MRIDLDGTNRSLEAARGRSKGRARPPRGRTFETTLVMPRPVDAKQGERPLAAPERRAPRSEPQSAEPANSGAWRSALMAGWKTVRGRLQWIILLGLLASLLTYLSTDAKFFIYRAKVIGARHLDPVRVYEVAGIHKQNIFWLQPEAVARRILVLEGIKTANVRLRLPGAVTIEIEERQPRVMWRAAAQGRDWWLDEEGFVLPYHGDPEAPETVFVVDGSDRHLAEGQRLEPPEIVDSVVQLSSGLPGLRVLYYESDRGLSYVQNTSSGHWPVFVGSSDQLQRKIQVLELLTRHLLEKGIDPSYVDVRWADRPVYGIKPAPSGSGE